MMHLSIMLYTYWTPLPIISDCLGLLSSYRDHNDPTSALRSLHWFPAHVSIHFKLALLKYKARAVICRRTGPPWSHPAALLEVATVCWRV